MNGWGRVQVVQCRIVSVTTTYIILSCATYFFDVRGGCGVYGWLVFVLIIRRLTILDVWICSSLVLYEL